MVSPLFTQSDSLCPAQFGISIIDGGNEVALNGDQIATLTPNMVTNELTINTSDLALHGQVWTVKVYLTSTQSLQVGSQGSYEFDITLTNPCTLDTITASATINAVSYYIGSAEVVQPQYSQLDS